MSVVDFFILGLIFISLLIGLWRGFLAEFFSLVSWIAGIWIGLNFSRSFSVLLESVINNASLRIAVSFAGLVIIVLMLGTGVNYLVQVLLKKTGLAKIDRIIGLLLGLGRGVVIVTVLIMLAKLTPITEDKSWQESTLIPSFQKLAIWLGEQIRSA